MDRRRATLLLLIALCAGLSVATARSESTVGRARYTEAAAAVAAAAAGQQPGSFCQGCRSMVSFMSKFNSTKGRDEYKDLFDKFCENYYPKSTDFQLGPCPIFVEGLFMLMDKIDPVHHCDTIGACGAIVSRPQSNSILTDDDLPADGSVCEICTDFVKQVKDQLNDPKFIDLMHHQIDAFCDYVAIIDLDKQCRTAVLGYLDQAIDFVKSLKPQDLCRSIQLCPASASAPASPQTIRSRVIGSSQAGMDRRLLPSLAVFNDFGIETDVRIGGQPIRSLQETNYQKGPNCMFCKTVIKEMFKFLRENTTEANIQNVLEHGCDLIYKNDNKLAHCKDLVEAYSKELVELLADETDPEMVCVLLEQCTYQALPTARPAVVIAGSPPGSKQEESPRRSSGDDDDASGSSKSVSMSQFISMLDPSVELNSMRTCVECKLFIRYLQESIDDPKSQEEIKSWLLNNLCANLGDQSLADSCVKFINQESAVFFRALVEQLNPKQSCEEMGACTARTRSDYMALLKQQMAAMRDLVPTYSPSVIVQGFNRVKRPQPAEETPLCDQCVTIVSKIDDYLSTHPIDHDIAVLKDKVCNALDNEQIRDECNMIIQTFGQEIIQAISSMDNPKQLCHKIALCYEAANN